MTTAMHSFDALMDITARPKIVFVRGEGSYLWDDEGKRYLDFIQGWAVNCLGHSPPAVARALAEQAQRLISPSPAYYNDVSLRLAAALVEVITVGQHLMVVPEQERIRRGDGHDAERGRLPGLELRPDSRPLARDAASPQPAPATPDESGNAA